MPLRDLIFALLLPLPPWVGLWIFRRKGRVGLSFGYFLGGILATLTLPWPQLAGKPIPSAQMGGALFGFTLFLQAHREGAQGLRRLLFGVGGSSIFVLAFLVHMNQPLSSLPLFWLTAFAQGLLWLLLSDVGHRLTHGAWLQLRVPAVGALALGIGAVLHKAIPSALHIEAPRLSWPAALLAGLLLGMVALQQLLWMRAQGSWVEGRGEALRSALSLLDKTDKPEAPALAFALEDRQPMALLDEKGRLMEANGSFSRTVGLPRHQLRGYMMDALAQGEGHPVWEDLKYQLLQRGFAKCTATLSTAEGSYTLAMLEAVPFDRGMTLLWLAQPDASSLGIRGERGTNPLLENTGSVRVLANALGTIIPAVEQILAETQEPRTREAAERILLGAHRVGAAREVARDEMELEASSSLDAMVPRIQRMLPPGFRVGHRAGPITLRTSVEALQKMVTHLVLHARQALKSGEITLVVEQTSLGGRPWALLSIDLDGESTHRPPKEMLGLSWLQEAVRSGHGMLELSEDPEGGLWPNIFLPMAREQILTDAAPLKDRTIWIVDQDPLVRDALEALVRDQGGAAQAFEDLREMLRGTRQSNPPQVLVLERNPQLDRFQKALRGFQREAIPTLVLGSGDALFMSPIGLGLRKVGFLDKPFPSQDFVQSVLALLDH